VTRNVLILCTHNSARSVLGEAMLNHWAHELGADVRGYSAGSAGGGRVNPLALEVLSAAGIATTGLHSKGWDEFARPGAPSMRIVITVCDNAAAEPCPYWPGSPVQVHWSYPDPSNSPEETRKTSFELTRQAVGYRMLQLLRLPLDTLGDTALRDALAAIAAG
jgi:arsenate reductase